MPKASGDGARLVLAGHTMSYNLNSLGRTIASAKQYGAYDVDPKQYGAYDVEPERELGVGARVVLLRLHDYVHCLMHESVFMSAFRVSCFVLGFFPPSFGVKRFRIYC